MDPRTFYGKRNGNSGIPVDPHDEAVLGEFRRAIWQFGTLGFAAGICFGILITPYAKRRIGQHANIAVPLGTGAFFSMIGSAIAANHHSHSVAYTLFKQQENIKMMNSQMLDNNSASNSTHKWKVPSRDER